MKKILVIGESCDDVFVYGDVDRLAPEAPVPVIKTTRRTSMKGMAGNVIRNIKDLDSDVDLITNKNVITKTRYVCDKYNYILLRVDENDSCDRIDMNQLRSIPYSEYSAVVISDYNKGFLSKYDINYISRQHELVFLDTKKILGSWCENISFIKVNYNEWKLSKEFLVDNPNVLNKCIITRGKFGCDFRGKQIPTRDVPVKDVSGAGDTFLSGLVVEYINSFDIYKSIDFAQECTTIVVQKPGVATIKSQFNLD